MRYLTTNEIKENSVIVIDFKNGQSEPFFVNDRHVGANNQVIVLGEKISDIIKDPSRYPCQLSQLERFYFQDGGSGRLQDGIIGCRALEEAEKEKWVSELRQIIGLEPLVEIILRS
ncbi:MAG: hypothetical protein WC564_01255 [Patescibacteria group bacterium]|jgi:hypothetical protein